jgi:type VI secretion system protein ImpM
VRRALLFGKLPGHGDFIARGLEPEEQRTLDAWLSDELMQARATCGEGFEEAFDTARPWRFACVDASWTAGALAPSMDSAGRRFPLLLALTGLEAEQARDGAALSEDGIFEAVAGGQIDPVIARLATAELAAGEPPGEEGWWLPGDDPPVLRRMSGRRPQGLLCEMLLTSGEAT